MTTTRIALINWTYGQMKAETLGAQVLRLENFLSVNPVHPSGGKDGGKDMVGWRDGKKVIGGCFFPNQSEDKSAEAVEKKFLADLNGAIKNGAEIFAFLTNAPVTNGLEEALCEHGKKINCLVEVFDLDRITQILDHPRGFFLRFQILEIKMTDEEQLSFFKQWESIVIDEIRRVGSQVSNMSGEMSEMKEMIAQIHRTTLGQGAANTGNNERAIFK